MDFHWHVSHSIFFYKILLWILFADCGPGYNLRWYINPSPPHHCFTTTLNYILAHNLWTEFKVEFYKRMRYVRQCHANQNTQNHRRSVIWTLTTIHEDQNMSILKVFTSTFSKLFRFHTFIFQVFNIIKNTDCKQGPPPSFLLYLSCKVFVLTGRKM